MVVMTCPRCGGRGFIIQGDARTTIGQYETVCPSCQGSGFVTDNPQPQFPISPKTIEAGLNSIGEIHYFKCPKCGELIEVKIGHYLAFPESAKKL